MGEHIGNPGQGQASLIDADRDLRSRSARANRPSATVLQRADRTVMPASDPKAPRRSEAPADRPARAAALSRWYPSGRPVRNPVKAVPQVLLNANRMDGERDPARWTLVGIRAADDLGMTRLGMTYDKDYGTSACFYEKPRRMQYMEGPNEPAVGDHMEMAPRYLDFQFQPIELIFRRPDGRIIRKYPDAGIELFDHTVHFIEIKSDRAWFAAEGVRRPLDRIDRALADEGLGRLLRVEGGAFWRDDAVREAHAVAMNARLTAFDPERDVDAVQAAIREAGGKASYDRVVAAIGGKRTHAADKLYAMLMRRHVEFGLSTLPTADTPVSIPRAAQAHALRETLARFRRTDA